MIPDGVLEQFCTADNEFFWQGTVEGKLLLQRCGACGHLRHPPAPLCPRCRSFDWEPWAVAGTGSIYSWVAPRHPVAEWVPADHVVGLIELPEGVRYVSAVLDVTPATVTIGMPVQLTFLEPLGRRQLPYFRVVAT